MSIPVLGDPNVTSAVPALIGFWASIAAVVALASIRIVATGERIPPERWLTVAVFFAASFAMFVILTMAPDQALIVGSIVFPGALLLLFWYVRRGGSSAASGHRWTIRVILAAAGFWLGLLALGLAIVTSK